MDLVIPAGKIEADVVQRSKYYLDANGGQKNIATQATFKVTDALPAPDPVAFKVTGTPSLTNNFTVTFTSTSTDSDGELLGAKITEADLDLTNAFVLDLREAKTGDYTVWSAFIAPADNAKEVSVSLKTGDTVKPDSALGMVSTGGPAAPTAVTAMANLDTITLTWTAPANVSSYVITQTGTANATYTAAKADTSFTTPTLIVNGKYDFTIAGKNDKGTGPASAKVSATTPGLTNPTDKQPVIDIPTVYDSSDPIELGSRFRMPRIPAYGWAVLVRDEKYSHIYTPQGDSWIRSISTSLPDLALFFGGRNGINSGTVSLHAPKNVADVAENKRAAGDILVDDIVISEIMWGVDTALADPDCSQWIEFYNTTNKAIDLTGWTIRFHRSLVDERNWKTKTLVDFASNAGVTDRYPVHKYHEPWAPKGQSGRSGYGSTANAPGVNIVSMYLDINYTQARDGRKHSVDSGAEGGNWFSSVYPQSNLPFGIIGTPGAATTVRIKYSETPITRELIINEIGNSDNDAYDWVEIYNPTNDPKKINGMWLSTVWDGRAAGAALPVGKERLLFKFPDLEIKPGHYVVFTASDPKNAGNDLAAGIDVTKIDRDQPNKGLGSHAGIGHQTDNTTAFYRIHKGTGASGTDKAGVNLPNDPNDGIKRLYILRKTDKIGSDPLAQFDPNFNPVVVDVIGSLAIKLDNRTPTGWTGADEEVRGRTDTVYAAQRRIFDTLMWPLQWSGIDTSNANFEWLNPKTGNLEAFPTPYGVSKPHVERVDGGSPPLAGSKVYQRHGTNLPNAKNHLTTAPYTGVGYDRHAPANGENGGTPGYANGVVGERDGGGGISALKDLVSISEIMLVPHEAEVTDTGEFVIPSRTPRATKLPQWIEIFNSSLTEGVNIKGWKLEIQNTDKDPDLITRDLHSTLTIQENVIIPPNQTVLIVSAAGLNSGNFPPQRTINLFLHNHYRTELSLLNRNDPVLSQVGFHLELRDSKGRSVDEVGNLPASTRRGIQPRESSGYDPVWEMPVMNHPTGPRTSLIRIYDKGVPRSGLLKVAESKGGMKGGDPDVGWRRALDTTFHNVPTLTYYGNQNDYGTPGYRGGGPLPVSLSKFRPERLKETGEVVIRWITESELNNAGFNILRSDTRNGEYTKLNTNLIAGQGTTSERTTYEWKDTSAKPNVAYYYQIQDVSLDGRVTPLRVNRLKGHVNAAGKATTTWGKLKALQ